MSCHSLLNHAGLGELSHATPEGFIAAAVFVLVQGLSYLLVYLDPGSNLGIVRIGVAYKAGYSGLAFYYLAIGQLPSPFFIPWAILDLGFMVGFLVFLRAATSRRAA